MAQNSVGVRGVRNCERKCEIKKEGEEGKERTEIEGAKESESESEREREGERAHKSEM